MEKQGKTGTQTNCIRVPMEKQGKQRNKLYQGTDGETGKTGRQKTVSGYRWSNRENREINCIRVPMDKQGKQINKLYLGTQGEVE